MTPPYVYPLKSEFFRLEFEWDPYEDVSLFITSDSFEHVVDWYFKRVPAAENTNEEDGRIECYFVDPKTKKEMSVLIADGRIVAAVESLVSYLGSSPFKEEVARRAPGAVGAVFLHKSRQDREKEERDRKATVETKRARERKFETEIRTIASAALEMKDFAAYVAVLTPYIDLLDEGLRKRFELARKKTPNQPTETTRGK